MGVKKNETKKCMYCGKKIKIEKKNHIYKEKK